MDLVHLFVPTSQWVGRLPTECEFYHWCCELPLSVEKEGMVERAWGEGCGRSAAQQATGVISREAIMASLHQNRKHRETGLFTPTRARSTAQSTLAPFSHPHILWIRALSAARLLCPHRRCHKKPSMPPNLHTTPALFDLKKETQVNLLIVLCDYSSGLLLWVTRHERDTGCPKALKTKNKATSEGPTEVQYD